jgi:hypothetical protein
MAAPDSLPAAASGCVRSPAFWFGLNCVCFVALYWGLRIGYWRETTEAPFSDMGAYIQVADNIVAHRFWGVNNQVHSYFAPVTPTVIALAKLISAEHYHAVYQFIVAVLNFTAVALLGREIAKFTGRTAMGWLFCYLVALAKPSVFWSLKLSTEGLAEALIHLSVALSLMSIRLRSKILCFASGLVYLVLCLNRQQFFAGAPLLFLFFASGPAPSESWRAVRGLFSGSTPAGARIRVLAQSQVFAALFLAGVLIAWSPWLVRGYRSYHTFLPTSTSGAGAILWEYGGTPIRVRKYERVEGPNGVIFTDRGMLGRKIPNDFPNDYQYQEYMRPLSILWLRLNARELPLLYTTRLKHLVAVPGASGLTRVSRDQLFLADYTGYNLPYTHVSWLNTILLDKSAVACFLALAGLVVLAWRRWTTALPFATVALCPWAAVVATVGYERAVEPMIPVLLWLALYALGAFFTRVAQGDARHGAPSSLPGCC